MLAGIPVLGNLGDAPEVARHGIHTAILEAGADELTQILELLRHDFRYLVTIRSYAEVGVERVQVRSLGEILGLEYTNSLLIPRNRYTKRFVDLSLGVPLFLVSLPVVVISLAAVKVRSPGKGMFYQVRQGRGGKSFRMPKIRTMVPNAEADLKDRLTGDTELNDNWNRRYKLVDDPRVIPGVGSFLRRFSIDELPQLWSVVKGDMSLVGPRPLPEYHLEALSEETRRVRQEVRPGITGLWQIQSRGVLDNAEQEARDIYYVRNWTVWLDLYIIGRTTRAVITGRGAH
jgi:lipopolysaccharide/colanic/teichoic acid biosynthesis glycosyltransferase